MKKRLISVLIALGILLPLFPAGKIFAESTVNYNFLVATVEVTNKNASDILGDGNFSYDAAKNVLHVKGGLTREKNLISNRCDGLTVYVERDVTLDSGKYATIVAERDIKITGPGKLTLKTGDCCIYTRVGSTLTIENANIESTSCRSGICGDKEGERLVIRNSTVHLKGDICAFAHFGSFTLDDCDIVYPTGGTIYNGTVIDSSSNVAKEVALAHKFQLWVGGEQVNSYNSTDILGDGQFAYNIGENLLYVKREKTFSRGSAIENRIPGLEICVLRNTTLTAPTGLSVYADTIISGLYKLTLTGTETGIFVRNSATLTVKTDLDVSGVKYGIMGVSYGNGEKLVIDRCAVNASVRSTSSFGAVFDFTGITLNGCKVTAPTGGYISAGAVVNSGGGYAKSVTIEVSDGEPGDVDSDDSLTMKDVLMMRRHIAGLITLNSSQIASGDLDSDGVITMKDVLKARRIIAGIG